LSDGLAGWITTTTGHAPADLNLFERALTHGSQGADNYERLEFLGDRVLGLVMAEWLTELFPVEAEGALSNESWISLLMSAVRAAAPPLYGT